MRYKKFTIKDFRCFSSEQKLHLSMPVEGKIGSGITYIVGENNSGKTTLIEGLWMNEDQKIRASEKRSGQGPEFCLYDTDDKLVRKVSLIRQESYTLKEDPRVPLEDLFEIVTSRRYWSSNTSSNNQRSDQLIKNTTRSNNLRNQQVEVPTADILKDIEKNDGRYKKFTELVKSIIPEFTKWAVAYEDSMYIEYTSSENIKHKSDFLGDGVISVIRILAHLFEERSSGLIIDEPELSLHPLAQKKLIKIIAEYAQRRQIIISTHSPYFVSWEYIKNGAALNRVAKVGDTNSKIHTIDEFGKYEKLVNGDNWQQPYLMDIVSKEIFFQENILFVEGQEDVGLLQKEFINQDVNFFGYGVRGYQNFEFALQLASDLGIEKAGVLIDSPSNRDEAFNEDAIKKRLEGKFGSKYKIVQWNKTDIRDKPAKTSKEKAGYFDNKGNKKQENELDDYYEKIQIIKQYFDKPIIETERTDE